MTPTTNPTRQKRSQQASKRTLSPWWWAPSAFFAGWLPFVLIMVLSVILYKQLGLSNSVITLLVAWLFLPWVLKPFWKAYVGQALSHRWWALASELLMGVTCCGVAFTIPTSLWLEGTLFFFCFMSFACAFHNAAIDGICMQSLTPDRPLWEVAVKAFSYVLAMVFGLGVLVMLAGNLQVIYRNSISYSWSLLFYAVGGLFFVFWLWHCIVLPRRSHDRSFWTFSVDTATTAYELRQLVKAFFSTRRAMIILVFLLLYMVPVMLLTAVGTLFLVDAGHNGGLGLSPQEYGLAFGTIGPLALAFGFALGNALLARNGLRRWLLPMALAMVLPALAYVYLSQYLPESLWMVCLCMFVHHFCFGFGFSGYLVVQTDWAHGSDDVYGWSLSIMSLSVMITIMVSGGLQDLFGYRRYFILALVACLVTVAVSLLLWISGLPQGDEEDADEDDMD
jgi:PAT family beta-lactamase induction signal transducer AmpG